MTFISLLGTGKPLSTAFDPISLGNLKAWYKGDSGVTLNGSTVSQWNDNSGYSNHLKQSTATNQPTFVASGINGLPSISFDGSNDVLACDASVTGLESMTFYIVMKRPNNGSHAILTNGASTYQYLQYGSSFYIGNNSKSVPITSNVWYLRGGTGKSDGTGTEYFSNGTSAGTVAGGTNVFNAFRYVGWAGGANFQGEIAEILIFSEVHDSVKMGQINQYLNDKYLIY